MKLIIVTEHTSRNLPTPFAGCGNDVLCIQEESGALEKQLAAERGRSRLVQQDLAASLQESKEALHREQDIMAQLDAQDQVPYPPPPCPLCPLSCVC